MDKTHLPWTEKYRPQTLDDIIDHAEKIQTLKALVAKNEMTHLLFYGPPGCGKTSTILACVREMYGEQYRKYILELNASDDRGIDTVRKKIPDFVKITSNKIRFVILDEADSMTNDAQSALRRVIEKYSPSSRFCLICNNINKIISGLQSRCTKMRFGQLTATEIKRKLDDIITKENVHITPDACTRLIHLDRDFRQILNTLQCLHAIKGIQGLNYDPIQADEINQYLGLPTQTHLQDLFRLMTQQPLQVSCQQILHIFKDNQWNVTDMIHYLSQYVIQHQDLSDPQKFFLIEKISEIEVKLSHSNDTEVQLYGMIAAFKHSLTIKD